MTFSVLTHPPAFNHPTRQRNPPRARARAVAARSVLALAGAVATASVAGCAQERSPSATRPIVAVSVAPQAYVVTRIAGDLVDVNVILPPGAEAHSYEPTLKVLRSLADASLYVKVGHPKFGFEQTWLRELIRDRPDLRVVDSMRGVVVDQGDPHVWVAPSHVRTMARNIEAALSDLLPEHRSELEHGLESFEKEVTALDFDIRQTLAGTDGYRFFVFHPAWGYFAAEYGLRQEAIEREGHEPDPRALAAMIAEARAAGVRIIYVQPQLSSASAQLIADEIGARVESIDPLAYDWTKNLRTVAGKIAEGLVR